MIGMTGNEKIFRDMLPAIPKEAYGGTWSYIDPADPEQGVTNGRVFMSLQAFKDTFGEIVFKRLFG